jgi:uncharacterized surface protein with fasciclin (FAS1) repeats
VHRKIAPLLAAVLGAGLLTAAAPAAPAERAAAPKTIVGVAAADKRFTTLVALVKQAGLAKTLSAKGSFTVFAPTNAAFAKLKQAAPETYAAVTSDKALLKQVLTYHVLAKKVPSGAAVAAAKKGASVKTVQGEKIALSLKGGKLVLNGNSRVIVADVKASNGIVHAIDTVLVPPSAAAAASSKSVGSFRGVRCVAAGVKFLVKNDLLVAAARQQVDYDTIDSDSGGSEGAINTDLPSPSFLPLATVIRLHYTNPELFDWCT